MMKITSLEPVVVRVSHRGDWVFVRVHTDTGITGLGEASHSGNDRLLLAVLDHFAAELAGADPTAILVIRQRLARMDGGRIVQTALSAVEQALWDILGQHLETPIHALFGGALRQRLRLYANINRAVRDRSPAGFAAAARQAADEGFGAVKLAPFDELHAPDRVRTGRAAAWRPGVERVRAVRTAVGEGVEVAVDCHSRLDAAEALIVAQELAGCKLFWFEEPVHHAFVDDLAAITARVAMPTASGESLYGVEGFRPFLQRRVVDVLMPDVKHDGGLLATREIAAAATMHRLLIAPHNPAGPVATAATAHVASTLPNFYILEYAWGEVDWRSQLLSPPEAIEAGHLALSQAPGLGHQLNLKTASAHLMSTASAIDSSKVRPQ